MANIYNDSSESVRQSGSSTNGNFTNLNATNATIDNAIIHNLAVDNVDVSTTITTPSLSIPSLNDKDLLIMNGPTVDGLTVGTNNDILKVSAGSPSWSNFINLDTINTNVLSINGTSNGDIFTVNAGNVARIPISTSGYFLQSDGSFPSWSPLPNPLIVGNLQINGTLQTTSYLNRTLMTDSTGFIVSEQPQFNTTTGSFGLTTTDTQFYGNATWSMTQNAFYKIHVSINFDTTTQVYGQFIIDTVLQQAYNSPSGAINSINMTIIYQHLTASTNSVSFQLTGRTITGTANITKYTIYVERVPFPDLHT